MSTRISPLIAGVALIAVGIIVAATIHESVIAGLLVLGGTFLILFHFVGDRLKSVGVTGIELFEQIRDRAAEKLERSMGDSIEISDSVEARVIREGHAEAAAAIRAAKNPEEMADVLVSIIDAPDSYGPSSGSGS